MQRWIRYSAVLILAVLVSYGFFLAGSPAYNRKVAKDWVALNEMETIHGKLITLAYERNGELPKTLDVIQLNSVQQGSPNCGNNYYYETGRPLSDSTIAKYHYTPTQNGYTLCATFNSTWAEIEKNERFYNDRFAWAQSLVAGKNCFKRTIPECKQRN
jgi:hypothetical protein